MAQTFLKLDTGVTGNLNLATNVTGTLPTGNYDQGGITEADYWRITSNYEDTEDDGFNFSSNWERVDTNGFGKLGTGMSESSGTFTFPSTGIWIIRASAVVYDDRSHAEVKMKIETTTNNASYSEASQGRTYIENGGSTSLNIWGNIDTSFIFDVTNTTTHKCRLAGESSGNESADSVNWLGSSGTTHTGMSFIRLGDT